MIECCEDGNCPKCEPQNYVEMTPGQIVFENWLKDIPKSVNNWEQLDDERKQVWENIAQAIPNNSINLRNADLNRLKRIAEIRGWVNISQEEMISRIITITWMTLELINE